MIWGYPHLRKPPDGFVHEVPVPSALDNTRHIPENYIGISHIQLGSKQANGQNEPLQK